MFWFDVCDGLCWFVKIELVGLFDELLDEVVWLCWLVMMGVLGVWVFDVVLVVGCEWLLLSVVCGDNFVVVLFVLEMKVMIVVDVLCVLYWFDLVICLFDYGVVC